MESEYVLGTDKNFHGWEIERVSGQLKGVRDFRFHKVMKYRNGTKFKDTMSSNVIELRNLLALLKNLEAEGLLEKTYTEEEL